MQAARTLATPDFCPTRGGGSGFEEVGRSGVQHCADRSSSGAIREILRGKGIQLKKKSLKKSTDSLNKAKTDLANLHKLLDGVIDMQKAKGNIV